MCLFDNPDFDGHEAVHCFHDRASGLKAIIAIHNTSLGPALGGCRMWAYESDEAAITDALRLSQGMTFKAAMAGLPFGGGKSVIIGDARTDKSDAMLRAFGRAVESLSGQYYTGEDVGMTPADMSIAGSETAYVLGREERGSSGDPSPFTAEGVLLGIETALGARFGQTGLHGRRVAIQGLGAVGMALARKLHERGAKLIVTDIDDTNLAVARDDLGVEIVACEDILAVPCDVLAPCALGAIVSTSTLPLLACEIIAGSANNQLATTDMGDALAEHGILYAPDYVINAGGLINIAQELIDGGYDKKRATNALQVIPERLEQVFATATSIGRPTHRIADELARTIVRSSPSNERRAA